MKFSLAALVLGVSSLVAAQAPATLGTCGTTCVNGMIAKMQAAPYNCASGDEACYCRQADFGNGIRDCANEACGNAMLAASVISFAGQYCNAALATVASSTVVVVVAASSSASAVVTVTVSTTTVGSVAAVTASSSAAVVVAPVATNTVRTTVVSLVGAGSSSVAVVVVTTTTAAAAAATSAAAAAATTTRAGAGGFATAAPLAAIAGFAALLL